MSEEEKSTGIKEIIASITALGVAIAGIVSVTTGGKVDQDAKLSDRITELQKMVDQNKDQRMQAEVALIRLQFELGQRINQIDVIESYLDEIPVPAWLKKHVGGGEFEMIMINRAYERKYDISKRLYQGKRDSEVWPKDLAEDFRKVDMEIIATKGSTKKLEIVVENGLRKKVTVYKFYVELGEGDGVGGLVGC